MLSHDTSIAAHSSLIYLGAGSCLWVDLSMSRKCSIGLLSCECDVYTIHHKYLQCSLKQFWVTGVQWHGVLFWNNPSLSRFMEVQVVMKVQCIHHWPKLCHQLKKNWNRDSLNHATCYQSFNVMNPEWSIVCCGGGGVNRDTGSSAPIFHES